MDIQNLTTAIDARDAAQCLRLINAAPALFNQDAKVQQEILAAIDASSAGSARWFLGQVVYGTLSLG